MAGNGESSARGGIAAMFSRSRTTPSRPSAIELTELKTAPPPRHERFWGLPRLPACWHKGFDRAIARLDQRGYNYDDIVVKMRRISPKLIGQISPSLIEQRLLILDQCPEIDYWRVDVSSDSQYILDEEEWARTHRAEPERLLRPKPSFWKRVMESESAPITDEQLVGGAYEARRMPHLFD